MAQVLNYRWLRIVSLSLLGAIIAVFAASLWAQAAKTIAENRSRILTVALRAEGQPTPAPPLHEVQYFETDLSTLQGQLEFDVWQPKYLPQGFALDSVRKVVSEVDGLGAELTYNHPDGRYVQITESRPAEPVYIHVEQNRILEEVDIHGQRGVYYDPGGPESMAEHTGILHWTDGSRWFEMQGNIGIDEMTEVARSLTP